MNRIALVVGIDYYESEDIEDLYGCVNDATSVMNCLARHADGSLNFDCCLLEGTGPSKKVNKGNLKDQISYLFKRDAEIALFYSAGHSSIKEEAGYLITSDNIDRGDEGVSLHDILALANKSPAKNKIIILDSCYSGIMGTNSDLGEVAILSEGLTILTASTKDQYALEKNKMGLFTTLFVDALKGSAANLTGDITPGSIYAHIDQSLGAWDQRPIFKANVKEFVSLRKTTPPITIEELKLITKFFPSSGSTFQLDPTYEPERNCRDSDIPDPIKENTQKFAVLQKYNRLNLLVPEGVPHMWHAAMESKSCRLTVLGEHYRRLVENDRI